MRLLKTIFEHDDELNAALPSHRMFLSPTFGTFDFRAIHAWNAQHRSLPHVLVDRPQPWSRWVSSWVTPQLIFVVDGVVTAKVEGWPAEGNRGEVMRVAKTIGNRGPSARSRRH
jgi:hypothetical protein